jgi:hypothetical protein
MYTLPEKSLVPAGCAFPCWKTTSTFGKKNWDYVRALQDIAKNAAVTDFS